jgi:hypothetical protein
MSSALDALAQMRRLRHLLFETQPQEALGKTVAACLQRMPLLRRCGRRVDLLHCNEHFLAYDWEVLRSHDKALRQLTTSGEPPFQLLQEIFFHHFPEEPPETQISEHVLRMPNLRTLVLRLHQWRPKLLHLLRNVTDLSLLNAKRPDAIQLFNAVGPQLTQIFLFRVCFFQITQGISGILVF